MSTHFIRKKQIVEKILFEQNRVPVKAQGKAFCPSNIALCKYWGKRDSVLNLPWTSSLSISLGDKGAKTTVALNPNSQSDEIRLNGQWLSMETDFSKRLSAYLDLFREPSGLYFTIKTEVSIPVAAGLASSACGFAALVVALADFFGWCVSKEKLSILARMGSGSAARSLWHGFVKWEKGEDEEGLDSFAKPIDVAWPEFRVGLLVLTKAPKLIGSTEAMNGTVESSPWYKHWPSLVDNHLKLLLSALNKKDFEILGSVAENNALSMHALMQTAMPPIVYHQPETIALMHQIWHLRQKEQIPVYFTQDAGPNLKLLFLAKDEKTIVDHFPEIDLVKPF